MARPDDKMGDMPDLLPEPVAPRHAASLLVVRTEADGPKILMARRAAGHRFMPHMLVFPGGAVDPADFGTAQTRLRRDVQARLERSASPELALALANAACRELMEEVGLSLGTPPRLDALDYLCRAITPASSQIRFNARFFIAVAAAVTGQPAASLELEDPAWYSVEAALVAGCAAVTKAVLLQFRSFWGNVLPPASPVPVLRERVWHAE